MVRKRAALRPPHGDPRKRVGEVASDVDARRPPGRPTHVPWELLGNLIAHLVTTWPDAWADGDTPHGVARSCQRADCVRQHSGARPPPSGVDHRGEFIAFENHRDTVGGRHGDRECVASGVDGICLPKPAGLGSPHDGGAVDLRDKGPFGRDPKLSCNSAPCRIVDPEVPLGGLAKGGATKTRWPNHVDCQRLGSALNEAWDVEIIVTAALGLFGFGHIRIRLGSRQRRLNRRSGVIDADQRAF